jgi:putative ABC transport system substrate-binding protein
MELAAPTTFRGVSVMLRLAVVLLVLALVSAPLAADPRSPQKLYRIGMLERTSPATNGANLDSFRQGLRALGYVEGNNLVIEHQSADGHDQRYPGLAAELVGLKVDLILARGTPASLAAKNATGTIAVVITGVGDPVGQGGRHPPRSPGRQRHGAERLRDRDQPEAGPTAQGAGPQGHPDRGPVQHE